MLLARGYEHRAAATKEELLVISFDRERAQREAYVVQGKSPRDTTAEPGHISLVFPASVHHGDRHHDVERNPPVHLHAAIQVHHDLIGERVVGVLNAPLTS